MPILDEVRALTPAIRAAAEQIERDRSLPEDLVQHLAGLGVFRLAAPRTAGGGEADPITMFEIFEELGHADGSAGWCAMIGAATGIALGRLADSTATELLADPRFLIAGVAAPLGRAVAAPGGYRVSGRWPFASASRQATWLVGDCLLMTGEQPEPLHVILPAADVTVHDTWDAVGLRGTGSHDIEAADVFVPAERAFSLQRPATRPGPLFAFPVPGLLAFGIGAVSLGIARAAVAEFTRLAAGKRNPATGEVLAAKPAARMALAEAESLVGAGRAFLTGEIASVWRRVTAGEEIGAAERARLRLAVAHATRSAARAVDLVYDAAGGSSLLLSSPL
ncbi:acyl-CoA dehydrogenase family protein [Dactylosporangium cerinum]|uniref:Acyl-CoA dehydrogenase family protein n=1 Tax=Dactylosporangium cerinum TaxID=1434730 RepID=A0ABV9WFG6_9ACTN